MQPATFPIRLTALAALLAACGGGGGGQVRSVVFPEVPSGASEADCQNLCTRGAAETICTVKHTEFCVTRCRATTRELPAACASCLIAAGTKIEGYVNSVTKDAYCTIGGPAELTACKAACDDSGAAPPSPDLENLCQLQCAFYVQGPQPLACSVMGSADCLTGCRAAIAAQGRVCAQCLIEQVIPQESCINTDCDCSPQFRSPSSACTPLCDAAPP